MSVAGATAPRASAGGLSTMLTQVGSLARRSALRTLRQPATAVPALFFPLLLVAVNGGGLDAVTDLPGFPTDSYVDFVLAVAFVQGGLFAAGSAGTNVANDVETGFLNRLSLTPLRRTALLLGQLAGVLVLGLIQAVTFLAAGLIAGVTIAAGPGGVLAIVGLALLISLAFGSIGAFVALRTGSGEAVQGIFPLMFAALFLSSMSLPRDLIETDWFRTVATYNPVSYMLEGIRSLVIEGWDGEALALGVACAGGVAVVALTLASRALRTRMARGMRAFRSVALAVAWRSAHNYFTNPAMVVPGLLFPMFFFVAFAGGLSRVDQVPGFDYSAGYTAWVYGFVLLQASAFGGVFTGFGIARDFESGWARRVLLAAPARGGIIAGYWLGALLRSGFTAIVVYGRRADRGNGHGGQWAGPRRPLHAGAARQRSGDAVRRRRGDAHAHDAGRAGDAGAGVPAAVPVARVGAARPAQRLGARGGVDQPRDAVPERRSQPDRWCAGAVAGRLRRGRRPDRADAVVVARRPAQRRTRGLTDTLVA